MRSLVYLFSKWKLLVNISIYKYNKYKLMYVQHKPVSEIIQLFPVSDYSLASVVSSPILPTMPMT